MESTLAAAAEIMRGTLHGDDAGFRGIATDSRSLAADDLFFALQGPHYDGSDFVPQAALRRAAGAVVRTVVRVSGEAALPTVLPTLLPTIEVDDTRAALGRLTTTWRRRMPAIVIALTGSNGKTTCKELIASCLTQAGPTLATRGNLNNDVGVPLMLAEIERQHRFAVLELGANHGGEIAYLTSLVMPRIVVITNAGPAHLEGFGSIEGVARAKGEILGGEPRPDWAVLNADDDFFDYWKSLAVGLRVLSFGFCETADVRAAEVRLTEQGTAFTLCTPTGSLPVALQLAGRHNVLHACAAAAVAIALGVGQESIRRGLEAAEAVAGRLKSLPGIGGSTLYDDSYNANPASVTAAAAFLAARDGESWLILGDMGELGGDSEKLHRATGEAARRAGIDRLFATGLLSRHTVAGFGAAAAWFEDMDELIRAIEVRIAGRDAGPLSVLVKGSRKMRLERVVQALAAHPAARRQA